MSPMTSSRVWMIARTEPMKERIGCAMRHSGPNGPECEDGRQS